ncbi:MAG: hypothetical protein ACRETT_00045 [Steroidobacteraceae bacterium]
MRTISCGVLLFVSGAASAGVIMEMTDKDLTDPEAKPGVEKLWFENGQFRVDSVENGSLTTTVIFRNQTMYAIDHGEKSYTVVDKATMDRMATQLADMRKKMDAQMAGMPPEQRAMVEKMMKGQRMASTESESQSKRSVKSTGRSDSVAGRACRVWEIAQDGVKREELCVVAPASLPGGRELMNAMREMTQMSRGFVEKLGGGGDAMDDAWSDLDQINGIPILTRNFEDGKVIDETRLTGVREEGIGAAAFEVPKGFRQEKILQ